MTNRVIFQSDANIRSNANFNSLKVVTLAMALLLSSNTLFAQGIPLTLVDSDTTVTGMSMVTAVDPVAPFEFDFDSDTVSNNLFSSLSLLANATSADNNPVDMLSMVTMGASGQASVVSSADAVTLNCLSSVLGGGASSFDGNFSALADTTSGGNISVTGDHDGCITVFVQIIDATGGGNTMGDLNVTVNTPDGVFNFDQAGTHLFTVSYSEGDVLTAAATTRVWAQEPPSMAGGAMGLGVFGQFGEMDGANGQISVHVSFIGNAAD